MMRGISIISGGLRVGDSSGGYLRLIHELLRLYLDMGNLGFILDPSKKPIIYIM